MRTWVVIALLGLGLSGCMAEVLTTTAVQGGLQAQQMKQLQKQLDYAKGTTNRIGVEQAIQVYNAEKGFYPPSLDALVPEYLPSAPAKPDGSAYGYDPSTGALYDSPTTAASVTPADRQEMAAIRAAINSYGQATGYYPATLNDLVPLYLTEFPMTDAGQSYVYENQYGGLLHPAEAVTARPVQRGGGVPVSGGGPLGEAMTGIGIQQQLNSNSQSATNQAGTRARQQGGGISTGRNNQVNNAMDGLGL